MNCIVKLFCTTYVRYFFVMNSNINYGSENIFLLVHFPISIEDDVTKLKQLRHLLLVDSIYHNQNLL